MRLTERQLREKEYHVGHAQEHKPYVNFAVVDADKRRWWNAYWDTCTFIRTLNLKGKRALLNKIDRIIIAATGWVGRFLAGRIVMTGYIYPK